MRHDWPLVPLGKVITPHKEFVGIDDTQEYRRCRVQLHAQGIAMRDRLGGAMVKTKKQQVCRAGELLVAEIDAKVRGCGIEPNNLPLVVK
jgi:type I restriction enzyme S subunit